VIEDDDHLLTVLRYIEANPVRAKMVERASEYRWSSYASHAQALRMNCCAFASRMNNYLGMPPYASDAGKPTWIKRQTRTSWQPFDEAWNAACLSVARRGLRS